MKQGQGLSMNVIIIAAISLLVLVIISVLVLRAGGDVSTGTGCEGIGGQCVPSESGCPDGFRHDVVHNCKGRENEGKICCIPENFE
ncbi:hypothetical protein GF367_02905 [Candidatus Woesearchaeota archaeon]|nr:hypothetical protein [Candidatus Woesearchaeota archaeon]